MRGRAILFLFSFLLTSSTALAQCDYRLEYSAGLRSSYFDAVLESGVLWTATGYGVQLFDTAFDPPRLLTTAAVPATTRAIDVWAGVAYAGSGSAVHVLRRTGDRIELVRALDVGATVNDVAATSSSLFVATTNGLFLFDRRDALDLPSPSILTTSSPNVLSLARNGENEVLAADADASVERFNAANGSFLGSLTGLARSLSVSVAGSRIFVSDGQQTQIYTSGGTVIATPLVGAMTVAAHSSDVVFAAGNDRRFRALDVSIAGQPTELFAADILPTGGTVNRVGALIVNGGRLYVAAGDAGLITFDVDQFSAPFALRSQVFERKTSLVDSGSAVFTANADGGLSELTRFSSGALGEGRLWGSGVHQVHAFANDFLLTSSGASLLYWSTRATTPVQVTSTSFPAAIRTAILHGTTGIVLLDDGSLWSVDVTRADAVAARIDVPPAALLAGSDRGIALAAVNPAGTTDIRFYPNANFSAAPLAASIPGATPVLAMGDFRVAVFTFRGITVVDFASSTPAETVLPQSNTALVRAMDIRGTELIDVSSAGLRAWDLAQNRLIRSIALPAEAVAVSIHPTEGVATALAVESVVTVDYDSASRQPLQTAVISGNRYARKAVAARDRLFVFDGDVIDIFTLGSTAAPNHATSLNVDGAIDLAVSETALFVLFSNRVVASYTHAGVFLRSTTIEEGPDAVMAGIVSAAGAPWVSVSRGCLTTGCEERTYVLDPQSLVRTAALDGGIADLAISGTAAHALVELPPAAEIRSYSIVDPLHPVLVASRPAEGSAAAIAVEGSTVYTLGSRLFSYAVPSLTRINEELETSAVSAATDVAIAEGCAIITGRSPAAQLFRRNGSLWAGAGVTSIPGVARGIALQTGRVIVLTDYSIEIWSRLPPARPSRRRGAS